MDYVEVPIDEIVTECKALPKQTVAEAIKKHSKKTTK
jgi:hypothetical protein